jgi:hypothetical protein
LKHKDSQDAIREYDTEEEEEDYKDDRTEEHNVKR